MLCNIMRDIKLFKMVLFVVRLGFYRWTSGLRLTDIIFVTKVCISELRILFTGFTGVIWGWHWNWL